MDLPTNTLTVRDWVEAMKANGLRLIEPRYPRPTFDEAVDRVLREHGDTLRELADK